MLTRCLALAAALIVSAASAQAWDYEGHRTVNELALAGLPENFPAFVKTPASAERIAFLAGEPDRWRSTDEITLKHANGVEHYLDMEYLADAGIPLSQLSEFRYIYTADFAKGHDADPSKFQPMEADKNKDRTRELIGYLPWAILENYAKLKSAFSYLRAYEEAGTPAEIANAQANVIYIMGLMGHYVGDGAQPLHTSKHHNGWVGENPNGYSKWPKIHAWMDGGFIGLGGLTTTDLTPSARPAHDLTKTPVPGNAETKALAERNPMFGQIVGYLVVQNERVEPLYALDKTGAFKKDSADGGKAGREFIGEQLLRGGEMLSSLWFTAWKQAQPDTFLRAQLIRRNTSAKKTPAVKTEAGTEAAKPAKTETP